MRVIKDICYGRYEHQKQYLDMYLPDTDSFKVFVFFHGGAIEV